MFYFFRALFIFSFLFFFTFGLHSQVVPVGSGSYTLTFPGTDVAGRNTYPSGSPMVTGAAASKPIPTNDWWSNKIKNPHSDNLFNYPFTLKTIPQGLVVSYIPWGVIDNILPVIVGVSGLNASQANIADFTDWTVDIQWNNSNRNFKTTAGIGMPFLYFTKNTSDVATITVNEGNATINNEKLIIENARNGADFVVYGPTGSTWNKSGNVYSSSLNGKNYWSLAFIPQNSSNINSVAQSFQKYAYVFPENTETTWHFNESTSTVTTTFNTSVSVKEGTDSLMLQGILPHQWHNFESSSPAFLSYTFPTVRGELKTIEGNSFKVQNTFHGVLPTLPFVDFYSQQFNLSALNDKVELLKNDDLATWTDSYNEGQEMNRLIQTARVAELTGDTSTLFALHKTVKTRLQNWLQINGNEVAFLFYYNTNWTAMIGYPAGHGQDGNLNDHHFHWGYFIHAASFVEQFEPGWASQWGGMVNLLVRDAASDNRNDNLFPFLRNFSPFAGHCWANGFATFPQGNDQESTSESMQFNTSLIHWGSITGNKAIRDLGIYLYTTEQTAIEEYWFDKYERNFGPNQQYSLVSRVWGNSYDNGTFWTNDIAASYGIELYPIHGGSLYLGHDTNYVKKLWNEIAQNTGILNNDPNVNLWHDIMWKYLAFINAEEAITLYNSYPNRNLKFGVTDAQTYHWLHAMNVLGNVDISVTANHPLAVFFNKKGTKTYVAQNYGSTPITVNFSDGYNLSVPPKRLVTSRDINIKGTLSTSFKEAYTDGSVTLQVNISGGTATKVEFYSGDQLISTDVQQPYEVEANNLAAGVHRFYAKVYDSNAFNLTNIAKVTVGEQLPFLGNEIAIPGTFDAAHFDIFEGGVGSGIAYQDMSLNNQGNFRVTEFVDAEAHPLEGNVVGWISAGEWLEYTIDVAQAGNYQLDFRYACGNNAGGGPFYIYSDDVLASTPIAINYTGNWNTWTNKTQNNIRLKQGKQVLKIFFENGELNLGKLTFTYQSPLNYSQPVANAGQTQLIVLPQNQTTLNGAQSSDPTNQTLQYQWQQLFGPSNLNFSNQNTAQPNIDNLQEGIYKLRLTVTNQDNYSDFDDVFIISSTTNNVPPKVGIFSPLNFSEFIEDEEIILSASASDLNDTIAKIEFYSGSDIIGQTTKKPYSIQWKPKPGTYQITAKAFDGFSASSTSNQIEILVKEAPMCFGQSLNGDFTYVFSPDDDNPTLTFVPKTQGMGSPTCILYYGTDPGALPGYNTTPNAPYQLNAKKGERIFFYYTYTHPSGGERNTKGENASYIIGSCKDTAQGPDPDFVTENNFENELVLYPNPVNNELSIYANLPIIHLEVFGINGSLIYSGKPNQSKLKLPTQNLPQGVYWLKAKTVQNSFYKKFIKY